MTPHVQRAVRFAVSSASLLGILLLSACTSALDQLEADLEAAIIAEDAELAERILADTRWTNQRDYLRSQAGEALVADWNHSEELRVRAGREPDETCQEYHAELSRNLQDHFYSFSSFEERSREYVDGFGSQCGYLLFDFMESALDDLTFVPGEGAFEILDTYGWVDSARASQVRSVLEERVVNIAAVVQEEIDVASERFEVTADDFEGTTTYLHKSSISGNGASFKFLVDLRECSPRLSLTVEYRANTWLFMDDVEFKQAGSTIFERSGLVFGSDYTGEVSFSDGSILERYLTYLPTDEQEILSNLDENTPIAVRLTGETRNVDTVIEAPGIAAMKETMKLLDLFRDRESLLGSDCG